jgi:putative transposase
LSDESRSELESITRSRSLPNALVQRARLVLLAAEGKPHDEIAELVGLSRAMVAVWR